MCHSTLLPSAAFFPLPLYPLPPFNQTSFSRSHQDAFNPANDYDLKLDCTRLSRWDDHDRQRGSNGEERAPYADFNGAFISIRLSHSQASMTRTIRQGKNLPPSLPYPRFSSGFHFLKASPCPLSPFVRIAILLLP